MLAILILPIAPGRGVIDVLPGTAFEPCFVEGIVFLMEQSLVFNQEVGELSC
jgi:hypothetical protein